MIAARLLDPPRRRRRRTLKLPKVPLAEAPLWATQDVPLVSVELALPAESLAGTQDIPLVDFEPQDQPLLSFAAPVQDQPLVSFVGNQPTRSFHNPWSFEATGPEVVLFSTNDFSSSDEETGPGGVVVFKTADWSDDEDPRSLPS